jgi:hypothetical protein
VVKVEISCNIYSSFVSSFREFWVCVFVYYKFVFLVLPCICAYLLCVYLCLTFKIIWIVVVVFVLLKWTWDIYMWSIILVLLTSKLIRIPFGWRWLDFEFCLCWKLFVSFGSKSNASLVNAKFVFNYALLVSGKLFKFPLVIIIFIYV